MGFFDETSDEVHGWEKEAALVLQTKQELFKITDRCMWCDCDLALREATLEHLIPRSLGGETSVANGGLDCASCNKKRGVLTAEEFRASKWLTNKRACIAAERRHGTHGKVKHGLDRRTREKSGDNETPPLPCGTH